MSTTAAAVAALLVSACGGDSSSPGPTVTVQSRGENVVSYWHTVAADTSNVPPAASGTPEEMSPIFGVDLAAVQVAVYDALVAVNGKYRPFAVTPKASAIGASSDAAGSAAAYGVLRGLFPHRTDHYQAAYDSYLAKIPDGPAKTQGLAVGAEVAAGVLALRANDGRATPLPPYVPGTQPGQYRGTDPVFRMLPYVRPFTLTSASQFRAPGPKKLVSAGYSADVNETEYLGWSTSTTRTAAQTEAANFHSELPFFAWPRNLGAFATSRDDVTDDARLMAMIWVAQADVLIACFESKYHYNFWRPDSAITLADTDGNGTTTANSTWTPLIQTPPHPEYPAGHACEAGAAAETIAEVFGTPRVAFDFNSTVTGKTHHYDSVDEMVSDVQNARVWGGIHFRTATVDGAALGKSVAAWVGSHAFAPR